MMMQTNQIPMSRIIVFCWLEREQRNPTFNVSLEKSKSKWLYFLRADVLWHVQRRSVRGERLIWDASARRRAEGSARETSQNISHASYSELWNALDRLAQNGLDGWTNFLDSVVILLILIKRQIWLLMKSAQVASGNVSMVLHSCLWDRGEECELYYNISEKNP